MPPITLTKQQARNFFLSKQLLLNPRADFSGQKGIDQVFKHLGAIQFDPLTPCGGNNVDLILQARIKNIKSGDYHKWLYQDKKGIELYDKEMCIVPIEFARICRRFYSQHRIKRINKFIQDNKKEIENLIRQIKSSGPICAKDVTNKKIIKSYWSMNSTWGRTALNILWEAGVLCIVGRESRRKCYDLTKKVYGLDFENKDLKIKKVTEAQILKRIRAVRLINASGTGSAWLGLGKGSEIKPILGSLIKKGKIKLVNIKSVKRQYVILASDYDSKEIPRRRANVCPPSRISFIAPLDNLLWDRETIKELFDFDYKWEVYTPLVQRKYGYYVLPVLFGNKFVGRVEPVYDKKNKKLVIKNFWKEKGFKESVKFREAWEEYLVRFRGFVDNI